MRVDSAAPLSAIAERPTITVQLPMAAKPVLVHVGLLIQFAATGFATLKPGSRVQRAVKTAARSAAVVCFALLASAAVNSAIAEQPLSSAVPAASPVPASPVLLTHLARLCPPPALLLRFLPPLPLPLLVPVKTSHSTRPACVAWVVLPVQRASAAVNSVTVVRQPRIVEKAVSLVHV